MLRSVGNKYLRIVWYILIAHIFCSCAKSPSEISITATLDEGDSIYISFYQQQTDQFQPASSYRVSKENINNGRIIVPVVNDAADGYTALFFKIKTLQDKHINIYEIKIDGASSVTANKLSKNDILWQGSIDLSFDSTTNSYTGFIERDIPGCFALDIEPFYYKPEYISTPFIIFIVLSAALLIFSLRTRHHQILLLLPLCLYVLCLPLKISWGNWVLILLGLITIIAFIKKGFPRLNLNFAFYCIPAIALAYVISEAYTINSNDPWSNMHLVLTPIAYAFIFSIISLKKNNTILILRFFTRFVMLYSAYLILCYIIAIPVSGIDSLQEAVTNAKNSRIFLFTYPSYTHPSFLAIIIAIAIPIAIYLKKENKIGLVELALAVILTCIVVALSGARIGLIVIPLLLLLGFLFYVNIPKRIKLIATIGLCALALTAINIPAIKNTLTDPLRLKMRKTAVAAIKERPVFGWGANSMEHLLLDKDIAQKAGLDEPYATHVHFHNQYLDMLAQLGFIGSLPFFVLLAYLLFIAIKRKDFLLLAYLTIYLPFMYVESVDATAKGIQPLAFWLCFLLSTQKARLQERSSSLLQSEE